MGDEPTTTPNERWQGNNRTTWTTWTKVTNGRHDDHDQSDLKMATTTTTQSGLKMAPHNDDDDDDDDDDDNAAAGRTPVSYSGRECSIHLEVITLFGTSPSNSTTKYGRIYVIPLQNTAVFM